MLERVLQNQERSDTSMKNITDLVCSHTASIQRLEMQMSDFSKEQNLKQKGTLPSDTIANPKGSGSGPTSHCMAIKTLREKLLQSEIERVVEVEDFEQEDEVKIEMPNVVEVERLPEKKTTKYEVVSVTLRVSSIIATTVVQKKEEPRASTIPCTIGLRDFPRALYENGASIILLPLSIYKQVVLGRPRPTSMRLQMADGSIKRPVGIVDDVFVKVGKFLLPADFVILYCDVDKEIHIILERPFPYTGRALMDSERNEIKFRVNDEDVTF
ncbi:uncharacterized protein [Nicotiana tomentosiformis]|uniref:uncharacterized protein n=1 Tax=Nicotiana tomentosiformis TaxID=4098 RepID=UPI00388CE203